MGHQVDTPTAEPSDAAEWNAWQAAQAMEGVRLYLTRGQEPTDYIRRHLQVVRHWLDDCEAKIREDAQHDRAA
jgi:hypothetical protein